MWTTEVPKRGNGLFCLAWAWLIVLFTFPTQMEYSLTQCENELLFDIDEISMCSEESARETVTLTECRYH